MEGKIYVDGKWVDPPKPKVTNKPAGPKVKKRGVKVSAGPETKRVSVDGKQAKPRTTTQSSRPKTSVDRVRAKASPGTGGGVGRAVGGAILYPEIAALAHRMTPEGYGSKAVEEQSPRDFNEPYQGPLSALGPVGVGLDALGTGIGNTVGEIVTRLKGGTVPEDNGLMQPDSWYQDRFNATPEKYANLASGRDQMREGVPVQVPPAPAMESTGFLGDSGMSPNGPPDSPVVVQNGEVKANPRYGMPESPYVTRRGLAERLGAITGGAIPQSMEGFMVANYMQNQLRQDDAAMVGDNKDIYEAELGALPNFMKADYQREMMPYEQSKADAYTLNAQTQAALAPSTIAQNEASTVKLIKEAEGLLSGQEKLTQQQEFKLTEIAAKMAVEKLKMSYGGDESLIPQDMLGQQTMAILSGMLEGRKNIDQGMVPQYTPGVKGEENLFSPDVAEQQAAMRWYIPQQ